MAFFNLPAGFELEAEALVQAASHNNALIYYFEVKKSIMWGAAGNTNFEAGYFGKVKLDKGAKYFPAFSNLYLGEVMRMDSRDLPAVYAAVKHDFAWNWHTFLRLKYILQTTQYNIEEIDIEAVVNLFGHFIIAIIAAHIKSNKLKENDWAGRIEICAGI